MNVSMNVWNKFLNKKVYICLKNNRTYSGIVTEVADVGDGLVFISLRYKDEKEVTITTSEIMEIKEED